ncbi:uncharacterized protein N7483_008256 [Penicillium malachiteum]|uniref:uncharacterized protein n=1 Tax=Penicillium malachiteum TaxID=1324776 RepID=UPI002548D56E|nr:uncharacterized protein N7483_008256 [Penicillium malachiteum]KAJ5720322.1 hypothetical protein N7483_008256 [Penicillium malachiteum]
MAFSTQPQINWNTKVQPLVRPVIPEIPVSVPEKTLTAKVQDASRHPWGVIDYHLYLAFIERGRDDLKRQSEFMLLEANGLRQVHVDDLLDVNTFAHSPTETHIITFLNLPMLPLSMSMQLTEQKLVLGFDLQRQHLLGYFFESAPDNLADVYSIWHEGEVVIDIHIDRFLEMYEYTVKEALEILGVGMFRHFRESKRELPAGMDLVVTIQFAQFLRDFAGLLWEDRSNDFRKVYFEHEDHLRTLMSRASWESWFAVRNGLTIEQYRQKMMGKM